MPWLRNEQEVLPPSSSGFLLAVDCGCWLDMATEKTLPSVLCVFQVIQFPYSWEDGWALKG